MRTARVALVLGLVACVAWGQAGLPPPPTGSDGEVRVLYERMVVSYRVYLKLVGEDRGTSPEGLAAFEAFKQAQAAYKARLGLPDAPKPPPERPPEQPPPEPEPPPRPPPVAEVTFEVDAQPSSFTKPGEVITLTAHLASDGQGVAGAPVLLVDERGRAVGQATTDAAGRAQFRVQHVEGGPPRDTYSLRAQGLERTVTLAVLSAALVWEQDAATGKPYLGAAADEGSALAVELRLPGLPNGEVRVSRPPALGALRPLGGTGAPLTKGQSLQLDAQGRLALAWQPPRELPDAALDTARAMHGDGTDWSGAAGSAKDTFELEYLDTSGAAHAVPGEVLAFRPPVVLVHGFLGTAETWRTLGGRLAAARFEVHRGAYLAGAQDIESQSALLTKVLRDAKQAWAERGVRLSRLDVVGHSMGGLIARHHVQGGDADVRKLIMVGTPNHGVRWTSVGVGRAGAWAYDAHAAASWELSATGAFLQGLNRGEAQGAHLAAGVQYGNLYVSPNDWVVSGASAWLDGVTRRVLFDDPLPGRSRWTHSTAIPAGTAITEDDGALAQVEAWLRAPIPRAALDDTHTVLTALSGTVTVKDWAAGGRVVTVAAGQSMEVEAWHEVATGPASSGRLVCSTKGVAWGSIDVAAAARLRLGFVSPGAVEVEMKEGQALYASSGGTFTVSLETPKRSFWDVPAGEWYRLEPPVLVRDVGTRFLVSAGASPEVFVLEGKVALTAGATGSTAGPGQGLAVRGDGTFGTAGALPANRWWTQAPFTPLPLRPPPGPTAEPNPDGPPRGMDPATFALASTVTGLLCVGLALLGAVVMVVRGAKAKARALPSAAPPSAAAFCSGCGTRQAPGAWFCVKCGRQVWSDAPFNARPPTGPGPRGAWGVFAVGVLLSPLPGVLPVLGLVEFALVALLVQKKAWVRAVLLLLVSAAASVLAYVLVRRPLV